MKAQSNFALTVVLAGLCWSVASSAAYAGNNTASQHSAMRQACDDQGGRFEQSWIYNDQGVQWGKVVSCSTNVGFVRCQGNHCQAGRWVPSSGAVAVKSRAPQGGAAVRFPAEPVAFSNALTSLLAN